MALAVIDSLSFYGNGPSVVEVASGIYAIAFRRGFSREYLVTVSIDASGSIGYAVIDSFNYYTGSGSSSHYCGNPSIIHVSGDIYAIAYEDVERDGNLVTVEIDSEGNISEPIIDSLEFLDAGDLQAFPGALQPHIIHISGDIYAIAYCDFPGDPHPGVVTTVEIDCAGNITDPVVDSHTFDADSGQSPHIIHISGTVYAIVYYCGSPYVKTITIGNDGAAGPVIDSLYYTDPQIQGFNPSMAHVAGDIYAIVCQGLNNDGFLRTVNIDAAGNIGAVIDTFEFDETNGGEPHIIKLTSGLFAIAYRGADNDGFVITIAIADNGTIGSIDQTLEYDTSSGYWPYVFEITSVVFAIAYGSDGRLKTIGPEKIAAIAGLNPVLMEVLGY
ncbi:hypothetical protein ES703_85201 [subsurface metagenome]